MTVTWNGKIHPFAEEFPLIEGEEFEALVLSVQINGLREPIVIDPEGTLLDGRNRRRACDECGVEPTWWVEDGDPIEFILDANLHRRHLSAGQLAMLALTVEGYLAEEIAEEVKQTPKNRRRDPIHYDGVDHVEVDKLDTTISADRPKRPVRNASQEAAEKTGSKERNVRRAKRIREAAPELAVQVANGTTTLDAAEKEVKKQERVQKVATGVKVKVASKRATFNKVNDNIGWAKFSWNPMTGCDHGCEYCYARELAENLQARNTPGYENGFVPTFHPDRLAAPSNTTYPDGVEDDERLGRVFVCSMADLFGKWVPDVEIKQVFTACHDAPQWEYMFLTKFPSRYAKLTFPPNAWVGASVDTQRRVIPTEQAMAKVTAKVRWLSLEPLLEPLVFTDLSMFNIVVIGAQTAVRGTNQYPAGKAEVAPEWNWVRDIVDQAEEAGCSVYLKENLLGRRDAQHPGMIFPQELPSAPFIVS